MLTQPPPQMGTRAWWHCGARRKLPESALDSNLQASRTYLVVAAIQHITQLHDHRVAADPHRPLRIILRQHPRDAQRRYSLSDVAVHIADCKGQARESAQSVAASMRAHATAHRGLHTCGPPHQAQSRAPCLCLGLHKPSTAPSPGAQSRERTCNYLPGRLHECWRCALGPPRVRSLLAYRCL